MKEGELTGLVSNGMSKAKERSLRILGFLAAAAEVLMMLLLHSLLYIF